MQSKATLLTDPEFQITDPRAASPTDPHPYYGNYAYIDTVTNDTTIIPHQGIKVMGRVSFDPKPLFGIEGWGAMDLKLYGEAAIIGLKDYAGVYPTMSERMPMMVGFGIPSFGLLDESVLEIEYYGAPFRDDYRRLMVDASTIPTNNKSYTPERTAGTEWDVHNMKKDNLKWSFYVSKTIQNSMKLSAQVANDHFRPFTHINSDPTQVERLESAFTTTKDWYLMFRLGFFIK
jgi:hypothetical protein